MKVKFVPQNIEVEVTPDKSLLQVATENHIEIKSICKGVPSCAECRVRVVEGESNVIPPGKAELNLIGTNWRIDGRRLSCQMHCYGDVTVDLTEQLERQENQTKKVRGFRSQKQVESHAVQDTMLLTEKPEAKPEGRGEGRGEGRPQHKGERPEQKQKQKQPQQQQGGQGGGQGKKHHHHHNKPPKNPQKPQNQN